AGPRRARAARCRGRSRPRRSRPLPAPPPRSRRPMPPARTSRRCRRPERRPARARASAPAATARRPARRRRGRSPLELPMPPLDARMLALAEGAEALAPLALPRGGGQEPHVQPAEEREGVDPDQRRPRLRRTIAAVHVLVAEEREPVQVDLDALGHVEIERAE